MKKIITSIILILYIFTLNAQQSTTGPVPPENIDHGKINKSSKTQVVISDVPPYIWHRGCGPTALGMVVGYYDVHGYPDLIQGDASLQTANVNNAIANSEHYSDYSEPIDEYPDMEQDKSELGGAHTSNCIADFMKTSWSSRGNYYGWSYSSDVDNAFTDYVNFQNKTYITSTSYVWYNTPSSWNTYMNEIDNNRPVVLLVDTNGDGLTDHFVPGIGYDDATNQYACYNTWDNGIHWYTYREMSDSYTWGVYGFNLFQISGTTSVSNFENSMNIYPNPVKDILHIETPEHKPVKSEIFNLYGSLIISQNSKTIDLNMLASGMYILSVKTDSYTITKKIIKQ